jgi:hypothetical protein
MTVVTLDISMSLDGYATAANVRPEEPMGGGGQQLHEWVFGEDERGNEILAESSGRVGATIADRRAYDLSIPWWGADGPGGTARTPTFIVSHGRPDDVPEGGMYWFVDDPLEAPAQARTVAGDRDVESSARASASGCCRPATSTRSACTSRPCSSAPGHGCSRTSATRRSSSR